MSDIPALETLIVTGDADPAAAEIALLSSVLYVVPHGEAPAASVNPPTLSGIVLKEGQEATVAFTRPELASAVFGRAASHAMRGQHLLEAFRDGWVVVNPGQDKGLVLDPDTIAGVLSRAGAAQPAPERDTVEVTVPDPVPTALVSALTSALTGTAVSAAWLGRSRNPETGASGWRIEVRGAVTPDQVRERVARALSPFDLGGEPVDLVTSGAGADAVGLRLV